MVYTFPKSVRLLKRGQYQRLCSGSMRRTGRVVCVDIKKNDVGTIRIGITVKKKFGKAFQRNRFKRIVREAFRLGRHQLPQGVDINIRPRTAAHDASTQDVLLELQNLLGT